ncbi:hypothetical protein HDV02_004791 [Globomyces sp. JEL0801]|nr:hypothetical protein HDV02_004791 [Globomyces sp. JEL0801]
MSSNPNFRDYPSPQQSPSFTFSNTHQNVAIANHHVDNAPDVNDMLQCIMNQSVYPLSDSFQDCNLSISQSNLEEKFKEFDLLNDANPPYVMNVVEPNTVPSAVYMSNLYRNEDRKRRNRMAAQKSRQKKIDELNHMKAINADQLACIKNLAEENYRLKMELYELLKQVENR